MISLNPCFGNHLNKANRSWGKNKQLFSQPLKSIEGLAYQGQIASRMGIIAVAYIQQAQGSLLNSSNNGKGNMDSITQSMRNIFSMSTKS